jgi:hypothetical protein
VQSLGARGCFVRRRLRYGGGGGFLFGLKTSFFTRQLRCAVRTLLSGFGFGGFGSGF